MKPFLKTLVISLLFILATSFVVVIYGFITQKGFSLDSIFNANIFAGAIIITSGLVLMLSPGPLTKFDKLTDHTTFTQRYGELRDQKRGKAYRFIFTGILIILVTGLVQLALWILIDNYKLL